MTYLATWREKVLVGLVILTTGAITMWAAVLYGIQITEPEAVSILGLGPNGFAVTFIGFVAVVGMFIWPMAMRRRWTLREKLPACLIGPSWLAACALCAAFILRMNPLRLPEWPPEGYPEDMGQLGIGVVVLLLVVIMSVVPAALLPVLGSWSIGHVSQETPPARTSSGETGSAERLRRVLDELLQRAPGRVDEKTAIVDDGTIVTSYGALADRLDTSKGTISRALSELRRAGLIVVETNRRETRIRKAPPGGRIIPLFPGMSPPAPGTEGTERKNSERDDPTRS